MNINEAVLTPHQAAAHLGVSAKLVYNLCAQRLLPHFRIGEQGRRGRIRIRVSELEAFLDSRRVGPAPSVRETVADRGQSSASSDAPSSSTGVAILPMATNVSADAQPEGYKGRLRHLTLPR